MWCTSCSLERNMALFLFSLYQKGSVSAYTTAREILQHSSLNCSPPHTHLLSKPGPLETQCLAFFHQLHSQKTTSYSKADLTHPCRVSPSYNTCNTNNLDYHLPWPRNWPSMPCKSDLTTILFTCHICKQSDEAKHLLQGQTGIVQQCCYSTQAPKPEFPATNVICFSKQSLKNSCCVPGGIPLVCIHILPVLSCSCFPSFLFPWF